MHFFFLLFLTSYCVTAGQEKFFFPMETAITKKEKKANAKLQPIVK